MPVELLTNADQACKSLAPVRPISTMSPPWLSILVPVYDVAAYLDACISSILGQDVNDVEVIFVDDASRDGEHSILARWQERHPERVRVVSHSANRGIAAARNTLLEHATGEYLWFVDSDDLMMPGSIEALRKVLARDRPDMVLCDFRVIGQFDQGSLESPTGRKGHVSARNAHVRSFDGPHDMLSNNHDQLIAGLFGRGHMHPWSKIVKRSAWPEELRFAENRFFEDLALIPRLALSMCSFIYVPRVWISYRQRPSSIVNSQSLSKLDDALSASAGYGAQLRNSELDISPKTLFTVAHFCTREWRNGIRTFHQLPSTVDARSILLRFRDYWVASSPLSASELTWEYLRRGQLLRCWQLFALLHGSRRSL